MVDEMMPIMSEIGDGLQKLGNCLNEHKSDGFLETQDGIDLSESICKMLTSYADVIIKIQKISFKELFGWD